MKNFRFISGLRAEQRQELLGAEGRIQREGEIVHLVARRLYDYTRLLGKLATATRDFH